jgi:uncharacterized membrane protein
MLDAKKIRKTLIWGIPLNVFIFILCIWYIKHAIFNDIKDLIELSATIRITPGAPVVAYFPVILAVGLISSLSKAIPCKTSILKVTERTFNATMLAGLMIMASCLALITPLQYYAMPKLGYTRCNILEGHPTIYFTDWVKNAEWCVRGKSREWVKDQALLTGSSEIDP